MLKKLCISILLVVSYGNIHAKIVVVIPINVCDIARLLNFQRGFASEPIHSDTPLHAAVKSGDIVQVRQLIAAGADVNARGRCQATPLFRLLDWQGGTVQEKINIIRELLTHGANINAQNREGYTLLHRAVLDSCFGENSHIGIIKELLRIPGMAKSISKCNI